MFMNSGYTYIDRYTNLTLTNKKLIGVFSKINNYTSISFLRSLKEKLIQLHHARHFSLCLPVCLCILCYSSEIMCVCVYHDFYC